MRYIKQIIIFVLITFWGITECGAQSPWPKEKTALLIIDMQEFYFPGGFSELQGAEEASANAAIILNLFRDQGRPVVHIGHQAAEQQEFREEVLPTEGEFVMMKDKVNAFLGGELHAYLKEQGITHVVICGMQTHMCVEAATRAASDLGYECTVVRDACATKNLEYHRKTIAAEDVHASTLATLDGNYALVVDTPSLIAEMQAE